MSKPITPEQLAASGSEDGHQMALMAQCALHKTEYPQLEWIHSIPNGGFRKITEAARLKATGVRAGVFDIFLPCPMLKPFHVKFDGFEMWYHGLYIEMKKAEYRTRKNGGLSDDQIKFMTYATIAGYKCVVCYSWREAWEAIVKYLNGE